MNDSQFPLQTVLRQRQRLEELRQLEFAVVRRRFDEQQDALKQLYERRSAVLGDLRREQLQDTLAVDWIGQMLSHVCSLEADIEAQKQVLLIVARECDEARESLMQASRDLKSVEKLRENWWEEKKQELLRSEQKVAEESSLARYNRVRAEEQPAGDAASRF